MSKNIDYEELEKEIYLKHNELRKKSKKFYTKIKRIFKSFQR